MITRIWYGWTLPENADAYEKLVREKVFREIEKMKIIGYQGMQFLRKEGTDEVEFISMMWFNKLENVKDFVGEDYDVAHIPEEARKLLSRYQERVNHYEVRHQLDYQ